MYAFILHDIYYRASFIRGKGFVYEYRYENVEIQFDHSLFHFSGLDRQGVC